MKYTLLSLLCAAVLGCGCVPRYFPAILGSQVPPVITAPTKDVKKYHYTSFDFNKGLTWEPNEQNTLFKARFLKVWSTGSMDANFGFLAYGGRYEVSRVIQYEGDYTVFGFGPEINACKYWRISSVDIGLGFHLQGVVELGQYYTFRRNSDKDGLAENSTTPVMAMFSFFPLIRHNISNTANIGMQCAIGYPGVISPALLYQQKNHVIWINFLPFGSESEEYHNVFSIGMGVLR